MKKVVLFVFCISMFSCVQFNQNKLPSLAKTKNILNNILDDWHEAAANADIEKYIGSMSEDAIYIGTDATESWSRSEFSSFCQPYFEKGKTWDFTPLSRNTYLNETQSIAWFDEILETHMGTCRGSGVLAKQKNEWKIKQYVLSMAIPNESTEAVKAAKKVEDDKFLNSVKK